MAKTAAQVAEIIAANREAMRFEFMRLDVLQRKIEGKLTSVWMPPGADAEYKDLFRKAAGPWLEFTRDAISQGIIIDGCNNEAVWTVWQKNGMDGRQNGVTRQAVGLGKGFNLVLPSSEVVTVTDEGTGYEIAEERAVPGEPIIRPLSSLSTYASYADPWDELPEWALVRVGPLNRTPTKYWVSKWLFVDNEAIYRWTGDANEPNNSTFRVFEHGMGVTPVAKIANTLPPEGEPESSVERAVPIYKRIVDATFTLEMKQRYGAFPQKWATGGTIKDGVKVSSDSMLHNTDPEAKFGNFQEGSLADVVIAVDAHIKHLAAVCQVPPHYLLGAVVNMSAEGIAAAESGYFRNISERQDSQSEGWELTLRLVGQLLNIGQDQLDAIQVHFEDVSSRSLAQISDAIIKLATLKVPLDRLFAMIPGFTQLDATTTAAQAVRAQEDAQQVALDIATAATPPVPKQIGQRTPDASTTTDQTQTPPDTAAA